MASFSVSEVEALLKKLDTAVSLFEQQAVKKVDWIASIELLCWFFTLALLFLELRTILSHFYESCHYKYTDCKGSMRNGS